MLHRSGAPPPTFTLKDWLALRRLKSKHLSPVPFLYMQLLTVFGEMAAFAQTFRGYYTAYILIKSLPTERTLSL